MIFFDIFCPDLVIDLAEKNSAVKIAKNRKRFLTVQATEMFLFCMEI